MLKKRNIYDLAIQKNISERRMTARIFSLQGKIQKSITPPIAYYLNKLKISADIVTVISFCFIISGSFYFLNGNFFLGSLNWWVFCLLDLLDGDIARLTKKKTIYGGTLDSFGCDIFYFSFPFVVGFYLFIYTDHNQIFFSKYDILLISFIISFTLMGYRIIGLKRYILSLSVKKLKKIKHRNSFLKLKKTYNKIDHEGIRTNFFSEPGIILNFLILSFTQMDNLLYYYLILISIYSSLRFLKSVIAVYISFRKMNQIK